MSDNEEVTALVHSNAPKKRGKIVATIASLDFSGVDRCGPPRKEQEKMELRANWAYESYMAPLDRSNDWRGGAKGCTCEHGTCAIRGQMCREKNTQRQLARRATEPRSTR